MSDPITAMTEQADPPPRSGERASQEAAGPFLPRRRALGLGLGGIAAALTACAGGSDGSAVAAGPGTSTGSGDAESGTPLPTHLLGTWTVVNTVHPGDEAKFDRRIVVTEDGWKLTILDPDGSVEEEGDWFGTADGQLALFGSSADARVVVTTSLAGSLEAQRSRDRFGYVYGSEDWLSEEVVLVELGDDTVTITHGIDSQASTHVFVATRA